MWLCFADFSRHSFFWSVSGLSARGNAAQPDRNENRERARAIRHTGVPYGCGALFFRERAYGRVRECYIKEQPPHSRHKEKKHRDAPTTSVRHCAALNDHNKRASK
nr:hypothetical protein [Pandoravirus massiliensis]